VRVVYDDGVGQDLPVDWDAVDPSAYAAPGTFAVNGSVAGVSLPAKATIRVTDSFTPNQNIALASGPLHATADASFSGGVFPPGSSDSGNSTTLPAAMLDGTTASGGWSNRYTKAQTNVLLAVTNSHASDWVSVGWPNPQRFSGLSAYFTTNANNQLPASVAVSYWTGADWKPVSNLQTTWATASNQPSAITFDPISTTKVKLDMTSASPNSTTTGNLTISEIQINGNVVTLDSDAQLSDLKVNGQTVPGFDPNTTSYGPLGVDYTHAPVITATAADNGSVLVIPPTSLPGTGTVTVTSEDGTATRTYSIAMIPATFANGDVGGTVPATLSLSLGSPATFGTFVPGTGADYTANTTATVLSTAGNAALSVADPSGTASGHLVNGAFSLPQPLLAHAASPGGSSAGPLAPVGSSSSPLTLLTWTGPISNDAVAIDFKQTIGANDALRTGSYSKTLTFTLSTTTP
jgi:hypothetical protein